MIHSLLYRVTQLLNISALILLVFLAVTWPDQRLFVMYPTSQSIDELNYIWVALFLSILVIVNIGWLSYQELYLVNTSRRWFHIVISILTGGVSTSLLLNAIIKFNTSQTALQDHFLVRLKGISVVIEPTQLTKIESLNNRYFHYKPEKSIAPEWLDAPFNTLITQQNFDQYVLSYLEKFEPDLVALIVAQRPTTFWDWISEHPYITAAAITATTAVIAGLSWYIYLNYNKPKPNDNSSSSSSDSSSTLSPRGSNPKESFELIMQDLKKNHPVVYDKKTGTITFDQLSKDVENRIAAEKVAGKVIDEVLLRVQDEVEIKTIIDDIARKTVSQAYTVSVAKSYLGNTAPRPPDYGKLATWLQDDSYEMFKSTYAHLGPPIGYTYKGFETAFFNVYGKYPRNYVSSGVEPERLPFFAYNNVCAGYSLVAKAVHADKNVDWSKFEPKFEPVTPKMPPLNNLISILDTLEDKDIKSLPPPHDIKIVNLRNALTLFRKWLGID